MIPKIIHQIWFGDQSKRPKEIMDKWKELNPDWEYMLWTEEDIKREFGKLKNQKHFDSLINLVDALKSKKTNILPHHYLCGQSDVARLEILYKFGGFFIDADAVPLRPLREDFCDNDSFSVYENEQVRTGLIANGYLASCKFNTLIGYMIQELRKQDNLLYDEPWIVTGPMFLTNMVKKYRYGRLKVYPSYYFIPKHYSGVKYEGDDTENIYCDQLWGSTWNSYKKSEELK